MSSRKPRGFFQARQSGFIDPEGKPCFVSGINMWYGMYAGASGSGGDRARLCRELDTLKSWGITNIRVLAGGEDSPLDGAVRPALITRPGVWNQELLEGLDFLLVELGRRSMSAVLYFGNFWHWSGGFTRWNVWADSEVSGPGRRITEAREELDCSGPGADPNRRPNRYQHCADSFYRNLRARELFDLHLAALVSRTNSISGQAYREDPAIFSWQLANEPRGGEGSPRRSGYQHWADWIRTSARLIKSLDPVHMVSTGTEGSMGSAENLEAWQEAHLGPDIDYLTCHIWPKNWGWWTNVSPESADWKGAMEAVGTHTLAYLEDHLKVAEKQGKPLVLEEFGIGRDHEECSPASPCRSRNTYFRQVFTALRKFHAAGRPMGGFNVWSWGGECRPPRISGSSSVWQSGDPWCGDPPQEPQGLNSVFDTDHETLALFSARGD